MTAVKKPKTEKEVKLDHAAGEEIKDFIKNEMERYNVNYATLARRMTGMGRNITTQSLRNKISRSSHQSAWFWDLMKAIRNEH